MIQDIKAFVEEKIPELKDRLFPLFTTDIKKISVVYDVTPITGGHVKESQVELKVIWKDYDTCQEIGQKLTDLLDMEEDVPFKVQNNTIFHSQLAGGGCIFNDQIQMAEDTYIF